MAAEYSCAVRRARKSAVWKMQPLESENSSVNVDAPIIPKRRLGMIGAYRDSFTAGIAARA